MKETFYFSHDYNVRTDDKIKRMIRKNWMEWYWIYWALIEDLYYNAEAMQLDCDGIAYDLRVDEKKVKSVIEDFWLFIIEKNTFYSQWVFERLEQRNTKSAKARENANKRWNKKNTNGMQSQCNRIKNECKPNAIKERKGKESKVNIIKENIKEKNTQLINNNKIKLLDTIDQAEIIQKYNITETELSEEVEKFIEYRTEPNEKWKQRYQFEKTFDPNRRLATRLRNNNKWQKTLTNNKTPRWIWIVE